jgi:hypothetical protein
MSKNAVPVIDAETQQFHDDLLQSVREFKAGKFARVTQFGYVTLEVKATNEESAGRFPQAIQPDITR